jgi:hypothetical protein
MTTDKLSDTRRRALTDDELVSVLEAIAAGSWVDGVVAFYALHGVDMADPNGGPISPADYAIPADQWGTIAEACGSSSSGDRLRGVNHMLDWMNYGPSSLEAAPAPLVVMLPDGVLAPSPTGGSCVTCAHPAADHWVGEPGGCEAPACACAGYAS